VRARSAKLSSSIPKRMRGGGRTLLSLGVALLGYRTVTETRCIEKIRQRVQIPPRKKIEILSLIILARLAGPPLHKGRKREAGIREGKLSRESGGRERERKRLSLPPITTTVFDGGPRQTARTLFASSSERDASCR